ncbi:hypothetical protein BC628DRAFT_366779 [Trametes gibbosa]|nr:hypothetical protein BC628DRAFT_366779 [Trametes gibbosa]
MPWVGARAHACHQVRMGSSVGVSAAVCCVHAPDNSPGGGEGGRAGARGLGVVRATTLGDRCRRAMAYHAAKLEMGRGADRARASAVVLSSRRAGERQPARADQVVARQEHDRTGRARRRLRLNVLQLVARGAPSARAWGRLVPPLRAEMGCVERRRVRAS